MLLLLLLVCICTQHANTKIPEYTDSTDVRDDLPDNTQSEYYRDEGSGTLKKIRRGEIKFNMFLNN